MSAIDQVMSQIRAAIAAGSKKEEYIVKIIEIADNLTDAQVEYTYRLIKQLFGKTTD